MSALALRPSQPPDVHALRAKAVGKLRHPRRQEARARGALAMYRAAHRVSDAVLGEHVGGKDDGATVRTGAMVLTAHEVALLLPLDVAISLLVDALRDRAVRELAEDNVAPELVSRLASTLAHLEAIESLAANPEPAIDILIASLRERIQRAHAAAPTALHHALALAHLSAIEALRPET